MSPGSSCSTMLSSGRRAALARSSSRPRRACAGRAATRRWSAGPRGPSTSAYRAGSGTSGSASIRSSRSRVVRVRLNSPDQRPSTGLVAGKCASSQAGCSSGTRTRSPVAYRRSSVHSRYGTYGVWTRTPVPPGGVGAYVTGSRISVQPNSVLWCRCPAVQGEPPEGRVSVIMYPAETRAPKAASARSRSGADSTSPPTARCSRPKSADRHPSRSAVWTRAAR